jgi:hypothetical protein
MFIDEIMQRDIDKEKLYKIIKEGQLLGLVYTK